VVGLRPRVGLERVVGRQITRGVVVEEGGWKAGRPGRRRWVRALWTRAWAAWGVEARTRQMMWGEEGWVRRRERRCAPRAPVAPVRICGWLLSGREGRKHEGTGEERSKSNQSRAEKVKLTMTSLAPKGVWPLVAVLWFKVLSWFAKRVLRSSKELYFCTRSCISSISSSCSMALPWRMLTIYFAILRQMLVVGDPHCYQETYAWMEPQS